jgi:hypothetical protein
MRDPAVREALTRIEMEFAEMPGLKLTAPQVNRLCNLPQEVCESALDALTRSGYLKLTDGTFLRHGRRPPRRAIIA